MIVFNEEFSSQHQPHSDDVATVQKNFKHSQTLGFPDLDLDEGENTGKALIIGAGPSLQQDIEGQTHLNKLNSRTDGLKVVTGSAHMRLDLPEDNVKRLEKADLHIELTAENAKPEYLNPREHMEYWPASTSSAAFFETLKGHKNVKLWNPLIEGMEYPEDASVVGPGSTSPTAALVLLAQKGYRHFEFYGVDGSVQGFPPNYYDEELKDRLSIPDKSDIPNYIVAAGGQEWEVPENFWKQQEELYDLIKHLRKEYNIEVKFHGESLSAAMLNTPNATYKVLHDPYNPIQKFEPEI